MRLELTEREAFALERALDVHVSELTKELVRTEKFELQRALNERTELLNGILRRLRRDIHEERQPAPM